MCLGGGLDPRRVAMAGTSAAAEALAPEPEPSPFAEAPPDMVNSRIIDPNSPRERTSYSDRNTPRDENKSKLQAKPKEELPPPRTGSGILGASGFDPLTGRKTRSIIKGSGVNI